MPSTSQRKIDIAYEAKEKISSAAFIPRFLSSKAEELVKDKGDVGVRVFNCDKYSHFSPFLTMSDITVNPPLMFPDHPHCGHDMMMYVLDGEFTHEDFLGWKETFGEGDLHWMRTGKGIIHAQVPGNRPPNRHVQFWINLPKEKKYAEPGNQTLRAKSTPTITEGSSEIKLLIGEYKGKKSSINTATPITMMDILVKKESKLDLELPGKFVVGMYVIDGSGTIGDKSVKTSSVLLSEATGNDAPIQISASKESLRVILFSGLPIRDPIDVDGFFVCCEKDETQKAVSEFNDRVGNFKKGSTWSSSISAEKCQP